MGQLSVGDLGQNYSGANNVIQLALDEPALSPCELAVRFTDTESYFLSEASVYRLLKEHHLNASPASYCQPSLAAPPAGGLDQTTDHCRPSLAAPSAGSMTAPHRCARASLNLPSPCLKKP